MTDAEILGLFEKTEFPEFLGEDNAEDFIRNKTHFPETFKFTWNMGASKLVILPYATVSFETVDELTDTIRGNGGFNSTGV